MKKDVHPDYTQNAKITCACGTVYEIGSTSPVIQVELCAACHPFYTGKQKIIDTARRVEKFQERAARKSTQVKTGKKAKSAKRSAQKVAKREEEEKEKAK